MKVDKLWLWLAKRLPDRLVLWCYIRVMTNAWAKKGNVEPDCVTYSMAYDEWENKEKKSA